MPSSSPGLSSKRDAVLVDELRRVAITPKAYADTVRLYSDENAARMRDDMIAVVSHDLKNPLATIQLSAALLLEDLVPDDTAHANIRKPLDAIKRTAEGMHRLIHDLLDVAAMEAGGFSLSRSREAVDLVVQEAIAFANELARAKQIALVADIASDLPWLDVDRERIMQVFSNLLGNAIKFSHQGGRVVVSAELGEDGFVVFTVADCGFGIANADLLHVFDRYWQAGNKQRSGVGLGLAIAKAIVDAHGGRIFAHSVFGQGSQFSFALPTRASAS